MTRDELTALYEDALLEFLESTPNNDTFLRAQNVRMSAFFFVELSERWKDKQAAQMSVTKAAKASRKKMERFFNEIVEKELEDVFSGSSEDTEETLTTTADSETPTQPHSHSDPEDQSQAPPKSPPPSPAQQDLPLPHSQSQELEPPAPRDAHPSGEKPERESEGPDEDPGKETHPEKPAEKSPGETRP